MTYADAFDRPDWEQQLSTSALIERLKSENRLDYGKLASRVKEIEEEAQQRRLGPARYGKSRSEDHVRDDIGASEGLPGRAERAADGGTDGHGHRLHPRAESI